MNVTRAVLAWLAAAVFAVSAKAVVIDYDPLFPAASGGSLPLGAILITFDRADATSGTDHASRPTDRDPAKALTVINVVSNRSPDDITVTITREAGATFHLVDNFHPRQQGKTDAWGATLPGGEFQSISLDPFGDKSTNAFIFSFSKEVNQFSILVGDFGQDDDALNLFAYTSMDATGSPVSSVFDTLMHNPANQFAWTEKRLTVTNNAGFNSVKVIGGVNDMSVFMDRFYFIEAVASVGDIDNAMPGHDGGSIPEPATMTLLAFGAAALRRRVRRHA